MAVYKFRVMFEDDEQVHRDIEISSTQNFSDLRLAILKAYNITKDWNSAFYISDDKWHKGNEAAAFAVGDKDTTSGKQKMVKFIDDPHQRFLYLIKAQSEVTLLLELLKILPGDANAGYPKISGVVGEFPKVLFNMLNDIKEESKKAIIDPELAEFDAKMANLDAIEEPNEDDLEDSDSLLMDGADMPEGEMEISVEASSESGEESEEGESEFGDGEEGGFEDMVSDEEI